MAMYQSVAEIVGKTPTIELKNIEKQERLAARLAVKLEKEDAE